MVSIVTARFIQGAYVYTCISCDLCMYVHEYLCVVHRNALLFGCRAVCSTGDFVEGVVGECSHLCSCPTSCSW